MRQFLQQSNGARIRTPWDRFGICLFSQEHTAVVQQLDLLLDAVVLTRGISARSFTSDAATSQRITLQLDQDSNPESLVKIVDFLR